LITACNQFCDRTEESNICSDVKKLETKGIMALNRCVVLLTGVLEDLMCARTLVKSSSLVALFKLALPSNPFFALSCWLLTTLKLPSIVVSFSNPTKSIFHHHASRNLTICSFWYLGGV